MFPRFLSLVYLAVIFTAGCSRQPPRIVYHLTNWHYVSREDYAADLRSQSDDTIPDDEIERRYAAFLDDVERVQNEQVMILRGLIRERGMNGVFVEGVTDANVDAFRAKVDELRHVDIDGLNRQLQDETVFAASAALLVEIETRRAHLLQLGAAGRLMMSGELADVFPLEDARLFEEVNPIRPGGNVVLDGPANDAREAEMVKRLLAGGPVSVVVLGGAHKLQAKLKAVKPRCEFIVVGIEAYKRAMGGRGRNDVGPKKWL